MHKLFVTLTAAATLWCWQPDARASTLIGDMMSVEWQYPTQGTTYSFASASPPTFTVGAGNETTINVENVTFVSVDFSANTLLLSFATVLPNPMWGNASQNGPVFEILSGNPFPTISSVFSSNAGSVSAFLDSGLLYVNLAGWSYGDGATVTVNFQNDPIATPLPGALPLFLTGLGAIGLLSWRRRRKHAAA